MVLKLVISALSIIFILVFGVVAWGAWPSSGIYPAATVVCGNCYYVSPTGNDSAGGHTPATAWQTIAKVNSSTFTTSSTVFFQSGRVFSGGIVITTAVTSGPFTISSYGTSQATISSGNSTACITATGAISAFTVANIVCSGGGNLTSTADGILIINNTSSNVAGPTIRNSTVTGYGGNCLVVGMPSTGTFTTATLIDNNQLHDCTGHIVNNSSVLQSTSCIYAGRTQDSGGGMLPKLPNLTISNNTIYNCTGWIGQGAGDVTGFGIFLGNVSTVLVTNNLIHDCGNTTNAGPTGVEFAQVDHGTVQFNEVYNTKSNGADGEGIDLESGTSDTIMQYNYVHDNTLSEGFVFSGTNNITVRFNVFQVGAAANTGVNVLATGGNVTNTSIYNNSFYTNGTSCISTGFAMGVTTLTGLNFSNNVCYAAPGQSASFVISTSDTPTITGNDYFSNVAGYSFNITGFGVLTSLAALQAAGFEKVAGNPVGTTANPLYNGPVPAAACGGYSTVCPNAYILQASSFVKVIGGLNLNTLYGFNVGSQDFYGNAVTASTLPIGASVGIASPSCSQATAFIARTTSLATTYQNSYTNLICGAVSDGVFSSLDAWYIFSTADATNSLLNLVQNAFNATNSGLTFTANRGYIGDGSHNIDTHLNPTTATSPHYVQNSAHVSAWVTVFGDNAPVISSATIANGFTDIAPNAPGPTTDYRINDNPFSADQTNHGVGYYIANRTGASASQGYFNGSLASTINETSGAVENSDFILAGNAVWSFSNGVRFAAASIGGGLSSGQVSSFTARMSTFFASVGGP